MAELRETEDLRMTVLKAVVREGRIELQAPLDWPEGTEVRIERFSVSDSIGIRDEDWPTSLDGMARHLALMDQFDPLDISRDEEAAWNEARQARKELEKSQFGDHAESLKRDWE